jgi:DNA-3-methyladenine glycosylase
MSDQIENSEFKPLDRHFFEEAVEIVAPKLLGCLLFTTIDGQRVSGVIIETEAYDENDVFSHCYNKNGIEPPKSAGPMFFDAGSIYLYYSGQMLCLNVTCERKGFGSAVLIRALKPIAGVDVMRHRRMRHYQAKYLKDDATYQKYLCNGPSNLCEALGIDEKYHALSLDGLSALELPFELTSSCGEASSIASQRHGLDKQLARLSKAGSPRAEMPETQSHLERKWRWQLVNDAGP